MDINHKILKALAGEGTQEEYQQLLDWQKEAKLNIEAMKDYQKIWDDSKDLADYKDFDTTQGWKSVERRIDGGTKWIVWSMAATLLLLLGIAAWTYFGPGVEKTPDHFQTQLEVQNFALQDDSQIWLNQSSSIDIISDFKEIRKVSLNGEAFFDIKRDEERAFIVALGTDRYLEVLGTSFNIINNSVFEIYVKEGLVAVYDGNDKIELRAGDALRDVDGALVKYRLQKNNYLAWIKKEMVFEDEPIKNVLEVIAKTYNKEITVDQAVSGSGCTIRSKYSEESLDNILAELSKILDLKYNVTDDKIHFYYVKC